jgi:hypothetical protein
MSGTAQSSLQAETGGWQISTPAPVTLMMACAASQLFQLLQKPSYVCQVLECCCVRGWPWQGVCVLWDTRSPAAC